VVHIRLIFSLLVYPTQSTSFLRHYIGNNEFFISKIKAIIGHVRFSLSYFQRKLTKYQRAQWLQFLEKKIYDDGNGNKKKKWAGGKRFYRHASIPSIETSINKGKPISFVKFQDSNDLFVAFGRSHETHQFVQIKPLGSDAQEICGLVYTKFFLVANNVRTMKNEELENATSAAECGLLLSFFGGIKNGNHPGHCLITEKWRTLTGRGELAYPAISKGIFESYLDHNN